MIEIKLVPPKNRDQIEVVSDVRQVDSQKQKLPSYYFIPQFPKMPNWLNKKLICQGYEVNLFKFTCNCSDYNHEKKYFDRDIRKACKHIYYKSLNYKDKVEIPQLLLLLLKNTAIFHSQHFYKFQFKEHIFYYSFNEKSIWVNIFARAMGELDHDYVVYHYNPLNRKWGHNSKACPENEILDILFKIIKWQLTFKPIYHEIMAINHF